MSERFNRGTGLLVIEVNGSNPNGDPDADGEPRTIGVDRRGLISPVSFKRKLRDLVANKDGAAWARATEVLDISLGANARGYDILESRGRIRETIWAMDRTAFISRFWDARLLGNTFLESMKEKDKDKDGDAPAPKKEKKPKEDKSHFISTGTVQFGPGISIAPIDIEYGTWSNKAGVEDDKDRGLAPMAWRFVPHALYVMPFFVNPLVAGKSGADAVDVDLMKLLIPLAYRATASVARPDVEILHAWYAEHKSPLGSCPDWKIIDALRPVKKQDEDKPSRSRAEYRIPSQDDLPAEMRTRLASFEDLTMKDWTSPG